MIKTIPMNAKQAELISAALQAVEQSREKQQLHALLSGIAAGLEGKLLNADTDSLQFSVEVPDIDQEAA